MAGSRAQPRGWREWLLLWGSLGRWGRVSRLGEMVGSFEEREIFVVDIGGMRTLGERAIARATFGEGQECF